MAELKKVLDVGEVELIDCMGSDLTVVNAARVSFAKRKESFDEKDEKLLKYLLEHGHTSPLRHCVLTFRIKLPIFVLRQWQKHRVGTALSVDDQGEINEISGRYVNLGNAEFYIPEIFRKQSPTNKQASFGEIEDQQSAYHVYLQALDSVRESYKKLIDLGVCKEQARAILPLGMYTQVYWTASLQAVLHFIHLRDHEDAQAEIREYARVLKEFLKKKFPKVMEAWEKARSSE